MLKNGISRWLDSFSPLRIRNLRIYLSGQAVSLIGTWMQMTAQSWVVWQLSHSTVALGIVAMLGTIPFLLLGPIAGAWADRLDRRKLLIGSQIVAMILAFTLALLVQTGHIALWHVYILAGLLGIVNTIDMPAQQAFIGDLSGMHQVRQAVVANSAIFQLSRMIGPAMAGWIISVLGVAQAFWINSASFIAVIASLLAINAEQKRKAHKGGSLLQFRESLNFVREQPRIQDLLALTILITFFGLSTMQILPVFVTDILNRGPETLGLLMGASGAGALIGSLFVTPLAQGIRRIGLMLGTASIWSAVWISVFALSKWLPLSVISMFLTGMSIPVVMTTTNGLLQTLAPQGMRARLMSFWLMLAFGTQPLAAMFIGVSAKYLSAPSAVLINSILMGIGTMMILFFRKEMRDWETHSIVLNRETDTLNSSAAS
jgi:MFS family permease